MKFRRDATLLLIGAAVVVTVLSAVVSHRLFLRLTEGIERSEHDSMEAILRYNLEASQKRALARAEMIAGLPTTRTLFAAQDRGRLTAEYVEMFEAQRDKHAIDQMHFYVPPATSFLRLHAPNTHGDDLSASRPMIVITNRDHIASRGVEIGFTGPALYGAAPVNSPSGEHIGAFEVGIAIGPMLDDLKVAYGLEFALFLEESLLDPAGVGHDLFIEENRLGAYLKYHSTHWELMRQLVDADDLARLEEVSRQSREANGVPHGVVLLPLRGSTGTRIGVVAVAKNFEASRAAVGRSIVWQALLAVFAIVGLAGVIQVVVRGFLVKPVESIAGRFAKLADGEPGPPLEGTRHLCDELQALAAQHERLRAQAEARGPGARGGGAGP